MHASTGALRWIVASYTLVSATLLIPAGLLGDRYGRKKVLLAGITIFLVASVPATYVSSPAGLIAARTLMGIGSAVITPLVMSVLLVVFPRGGAAEGDRRMAAACYRAAADRPEPLP